MTEQTIPRRAVIDAVHLEGSASSLSAALDIAVETVRTELAALSMLARAMQHVTLRSSLEATIGLMREVRGRIVVTGVGKSGIIARKIAATFNSTGTPAHYMHGGDASHGDLGSVTDADIVLLLSWSGESSELANVIAYCRRFAIPLVVMTGRPRSAAGRSADVCLALPTVREACPHELAPTSSTVIQLALGDALAMAMISVRGFSANDFQRFHPGGQLGAQLRTVGDLMISGEAMPCVTKDTSVREAAVEITTKRFGCTAVLDDEGRLLGAFTDGDLRRCLDDGTLSDPVAGHMSLTPVTVTPDALASHAVRLMNERRISTLFVCGDGRMAGIIHLHDLLRAGIA